MFISCQLSLATSVHSNCGKNQSSAALWQLRGLHDKTEKTHGHWLYIVYEGRKRSIFYDFLKIVNNEVKSAIIHVRILILAGDYERIFKCEWPNVNDL